MIVKILGSSADFSGVRYNTRKVERDKGELLKVVNFGPLEGMTNLRPQDYINYFRSIASLNSRVKFPQFHAVISCKGKEYSKESLAELAEKWLNGMGYGENPYMLIFHKDTANNHIHMVSTRIGLDGKKISDSYEKLKAYRVLNQVMGVKHQTRAEKDISDSLGYHFSTQAQWKLLVERKGYTISAEKDFFKVCRSGSEEGKVECEKIDQQIADRKKDNARILQIRALIYKYRRQNDNVSALNNFLFSNFKLEFVIHGTPAYGYTVIDHARKQVYKGGEIMPLAEFISNAKDTSTQEKEKVGKEEALSHLRSNYNSSTLQPTDFVGYSKSAASPSLSLAYDMDDELVHGKKRRDRKRGRTRS